MMHGTSQRGNRIPFEQQWITCFAACLFANALDTENPDYITNTQENTPAILPK